MSLGELQYLALTVIMELRRFLDYHMLTNLELKKMLDFDDGWDDNSDNGHN